MCSSQEHSVLICQAVVDEKGGVDSGLGNYCFGNPDDRIRSEQLQRDLLRSRFRPATINGKPVKVEVSLRVLYQEADGRCDVTVLPNLGVQQDEFGVDYFAPQEIHTEGGWIQEVRGTLRRKRTASKDYFGMGFAMSVAVDVFGNPTDGRVEVNNFTFDESAQRSLDALSRQRFIPGFVNGVPRAARYYEPVYVPKPLPRRRHRQ